MSCTACRRKSSIGGTPVNTMQNIVPAQEGQSIPDYLRSNGWYVTGNCGCNPQKDIYWHADHMTDGVIIWANNSIMEIRRTNAMNSRDSRVERVAGTANFALVYQNYFQ